MSAWREEGSESWERGGGSREGCKGSQIGGRERGIVVTRKGRGKQEEREHGSWSLRFSKNDNRNLERGLQTWVLLVKLRKQKMKEGNQLGG